MRHAGLRFEPGSWAIQDAEALLEAGDHVYWLPALEQRESLRPGEGAQLMFAGTTPEDRSLAEPPVALERMWVMVTGREGPQYVGTLENDPSSLTQLQRGMRITFEPRHIVDIVRTDGIKVSDAEELVHCSRHGVSEPTYVCAHLTRGAVGKGFNTAINATDVRPDAWCDECDKLLDLDGVEGWDDLGDRHPEIGILCAGCYDAAKRRNEH